MTGREYEHGISADKDQVPLKTYERVVFEGSTISIRCPHHTEPSNAQPATLDAQQPASLHFRSPDDSSRVKWFRNHVPLRNLNHSRAGSLTSQKGTYATSHDAEPTSVVAVVNADYTRAASEITELNLTTSSLPTELALSSQLPKELNAVEKLVGQFDGPTISEPPAEETERLVTSENVNEPTGSRKRINVLESGHTPRTSLYINKIGELVINKVSKYLAGKYTCLFDGRQSEVLLDVSTDGGNRASLISTRADLDRKKSAGLHSSNQTDIPEPGVSCNPLLIETSPVELNRDSGELSINSKLINWLNVNVNKSRSELSHTEIDSKIHTRERSIDTNLDNDRDLLTQGTRSSGSSRDSQLLRDDNSAIQYDSLGNVDPRVESGGRHYGSQLSKQSLLTTLVNDGLVELEQSAPQTIHSKTSGHRLPSSTRKHRSVHQIKVEAIQMNDIKLVPGFLYTKQQLYCPIGPNSILKRKHIISLAEGLCSGDSASGSPSPNLGYRIGCYHLAENLLLHIIGHNCSSDSDDMKTVAYQKKDMNEKGSSVSGIDYEKADQSYNALYFYGPIFELVWLKDGRKLEFSSGGRGKDPKLNVKLINSLNQSNVSYRDNGRKKTNADSLSIVASKVPLMIGAQHGGGTKLEEPDVDLKHLEEPHFPDLLGSQLVRGRVLEIDGVRREHMGRYTCALELNIAKLVQFTRSLRHLGELNGQIRWKSNLVNDNNTSCCDGEPYQPLPSAQPNLRDKRKSRERENAHQNPSSPSEPPFSQARQTNEASAPDLSTSSKRDGHSSLDSGLLTPLTPIEMLRAILSVNSCCQKYLHHIERQISRLTGPLINIQTFSLVVNDRPGK